MLLAVPPFDKHMSSMWEWDANHSIHMMHIDTSDVVAGKRVLKQGEIPEVSLFKSCFTIRFRIRMFFHNFFLNPYLLSYEENLTNNGEERIQFIS